MIIVKMLENRERRYSDQGVYIKQLETGALYEDAVDVIPCKYTYEETDIPIENEDEATSEDYEEALREVGVLDEEE